MQSEIKMILSLNDIVKSSANSVNFDWRSIISLIVSFRMV